jgi:hypothetical protein
MAALKRLQWSIDIAAPASSVYWILVAAECCHFRLQDRAPGRIRTLDSLVRRSTR